MSESKYIEADCKQCGDTFERFYCHPYIVLCKKCRKSSSKSGEAKVTKKGKLYIDGKKVHIPSVKHTIVLAKMGYQGRTEATESVHDMVTYLDKKRGRFFRIGSQRFFSIEELRELL